MTAHQAARRFHHDDVFELLMEHTPDELKLAVGGALGDDALVRRLLAEKPDLVRHLSDDERARVVAAAQDENTSALRTMLEAGWPVDARGQHGATALHWAAYNGNVPMVREILRFGPPLEARDADFDGTPLGWAIHASRDASHPPRRDYPGVVDALLGAGAKPPAGAFEASDSVRDVIAKYGGKT